MFSSFSPDILTGEERLRLCGNCQYHTESFHLLWCSFHHERRRADETCNEWVDMFMDSDFSMFEDDSRLD